VSMFGILRDGQSVHRITIGTEKLTVSFLTLGAILHDVRLAGVDHSLTLGSDDLAAYEGPMEYYGALVGPVANRIADATAPIGGKPFRFTPNEDGVTTLHGGPTGTHAQVWTIADHGDDFVVLHLKLNDGLGGFPGERDIKVRYSVAGQSLTMDINATTDRPTALNLANHSYWNLNGTADTAGHKLYVLADRYTPVDDRKIPIGIADVANTPFDYRVARPIGTQSTDRIDHNLCLDGGKTDLRKVAELTTTSGVKMTLETTEPGLQVYDAENGDTLDFAGYLGAPYGHFSGIAMESQGYPDAPNHADFPSIEIDETAPYKQTTRWTFSAG